MIVNKLYLPFYYDNALQTKKALFYLYMIIIYVIISKTICLTLQSQVIVTLLINQKSSIFYLIFLSRISTFFVAKKDKANLKILNIREIHLVESSKRNPLLLLEKDIFQILLCSFIIDNFIYTVVLANFLPFFIRY